MNSKIQEAEIFVGLDIHQDVVMEANFFEEESAVTSRMMGY